MSISNINTPDAPPAGVSERIEILDILRGFALFGMLVIHLNGYTNSVYPRLGRATDFLLANKALSIFSMLFGMGFAVQMLRMQATGRPFVRLYLRRMMILYLIGAATWVLVGRDILHTYAIYGGILLLFSRVSTRAALVCAVLFLASNFWRGSILRPLDAAFGRDIRREARDREPARQRRETVIRSGTYRELLAAHWQSVRNSHTDAYLLVTRNLLPTYYFPMFFVGFAAVKSGLVQGLRERRTLLRRVMWCALAAGLVTNPLPYLDIKWSVPPWVGRLSFLLSGPSLGVFYASAIGLAVQSERCRGFLAPLRWPGRMALTNYVFHVAIVITIYYGFGFGLLKRVNSLQAWGLALAIFSAISLLSAAWLHRFHHGPLEWIWRTLTYGSLASRRSFQAA